MAADTVNHAEPSDNVSIAEKPCDLAVVILNYNTRDLLRNCLRSVLASQDSLNTLVYVVDNASKDGSAEMVRNEFPGVHLLANQLTLATVLATTSVYGSVVLAIPIVPKSPFPATRCCSTPTLWCNRQPLPKWWHSWMNTPESAWQVRGCVVPMVRWIEPVGAAFPRRKSAFIAWSG